MKKKARIAWLAAVALLAAPLGAMGPVSTAEAEETETTESGTEKIQLDTPTNLRWGAAEDLDEPGLYNKYNMNWEGTNPSINENGNSFWPIEVYKDGQLFLNTGSWEEVYESYWDDEAQEFIYTDELVNQHYYLLMSEKIFESGTYAFRVKATALDNDEVYQDSEWSDWSEITYVRPELELGVVTDVYWDTEKAGICHFTPLEVTSLDASVQWNHHYRAYLYVQQEDLPLYDDNNGWVSISEWISLFEEGVTVDVDFSDVI